jgi:Spy/CpxP family protein refolding chaperone
MRTSWTLALLLGAALAGASAPAQMIEMPPGKWWKRPAVVDALKVTVEQQQRLEEVFSKNRRAFVDLKADVDRRTIDLEDLLSARDVDPKKVGAASEALEQARARLGKARTMMVVEMRGILTAEQWATIVDRRDQFRAERQAETRRRFAEGRGANRPGSRPQRPAGAEPPPRDSPDEP